VTAVEKAAILDADNESSRDRIIEDSAGLLRMLETVLVLHEDRSGRRKELEKMKGEYLKLEAENMKLLTFGGRRKTSWRRPRKTEN
jgi:hypothetical protein